jgi:hypothetical protein
MIGQRVVHGVGKDRDEVAQELGCRRLARLLQKFDISELRCPVDGDKQLQFAFCSLNFDNIAVEIADRAALELLLSGLVVSDLRQARDILALQTAVQGRTAHPLGDCWTSTGRAMDAGSKAATQRGNHPTAAVCATGKRRRPLLLQSTGLYILGFSGRLERPKPNCVSSIWPRLSG